MVLFAIVAIIIVLMVSIIMNLDLTSIIKRVFIGGLIFSIIGGIIGQLINSNLSDIMEEEMKSSIKQVASNSEGSNSKEALKEEGLDRMTSLEFESIDNKNTNIINEDSDKLAKIIKGIKQE
jgi:hypothetical protein